MKKPIVVILTAVISGCASSARDIPTQYVSPLIYEDYSCKQIGAEHARLTRRVNELAYQVDDRASDDSAKMAVGLILLWPTLFFIDGDGPEAQEYGRLKGEYEALEKASIQKECGYEFRDLTPPEPAKPDTPDKPRI